MRVLLIAPTALDSQGKPIKQGRLHLPGLTLPMLAAVTPSKVDLRMVFETVEDIPFNESWDLVGLTGMGSGIVRAWQIADQFRAQGVKVVIGGIAASLCHPGWSLSHADALVIGEAEELWPQVIEDLEGGRLQPIYRMSRRPPIESLPPPRYDLLAKSKIGFWRPVQATRGCPFTCNFCSVTSFFEGTYRKRPVDQVVRDVRVAKKYGTRYIAFIDDNIGVDFDYCARLWETLIPEKIIWMSQCSLHITERPDMMELAHRSGCRVLSFGIESINQNSLKTIDKDWNRPERYQEAIKALRNNGIEVSAEMVIGLDGDDPSIFQRTFDFIIKNKIPVPRVHIITPVPGTPLYEALSRQGRILPTHFSDYTGGKVVFRPIHFQPEDLEKGYWKLYEKLFSWPAILRRVIPNSASLGPYMRAVVWITNFKYRRHVHHRISPGIL
jgi:radical SAM superfamily enzyme YgiQ (UPF0313 family)